MRSHPSLTSLTACVAAAVLLISFIIISPDPLRAETLSADTQAAPEHAAPEQDAAGCPGSETREKPKLWHIPRYAGLRPALDPSDETAVLQAVHYGLTEVADGSSYIWHRHNGHLNGIVRPVASFRNGEGAVCRRIVLALTAGEITRSVEGIACREADKSWTFKG